MKQLSPYIVLAVLGAIIATCLVSLMVVFMGGPQGSNDFRALLSLQLAAIPLALFAGTVSLTVLGMRAGFGPAMKSVWRALPQWMLLGFVVLNSLCVFGEVSLLIVAYATEVSVPWQDHVPLVSMLSCSIAFMIVYAHSRLNRTSEPAMSGRW